MSLRRPNEIRPVRMKRHFTKTSAGSVLYEAGGTTVLCTASVANEVPPWLKGKGQGWITAEYNMLPHSTSPRKQRERGGKVDGRTTEIQRLIGRSLRAVVNLEYLGERTLTVDCDVLEADGGTRTASITGAFVAMVDALHAIRKELPNPANYPLTDSVAAISAGIVAGGLEDRAVVAFDAGEGTVLLLFRRGHTHPLQTDGGLVPGHDGSGAAHLAFAIDRDEVPGWELHLHALGVEVESRVTWARGGLSLYFRDPDGRSVELATPGTWPSY